MFGSGSDEHNFSFNPKNMSSSKEDIDATITAASSSTQRPPGKPHIDDEILEAAAKRYSAPSSAGSSPLLAPGAARSTPGASVTPTGTPGKIVDAFYRDKHGRFCCHHCMCGIEEDEPLFMRNDFPYCSVTCRDKGVSAKFQKLMREYNVGLASNMSVATEDDNQGGGLTGLVTGYGKQMVNGLMDRVTDTIWGQEMVRSYSQALVTSKRKARHSSMAFLLEYFPDMNHYIPSDDSFCDSDDNTQGTVSNSASAGDISPGSSFHKGSRRKKKSSSRLLKSPSLEKSAQGSSGGAAQSSAQGSSEKIIQAHGDDDPMPSSDETGQPSKESSEPQYGADY